jgi:hypothetical protein
MSEKQTLMGSRPNPILTAESKRLFLNCGHDGELGCVWVGGVVVFFFFLKYYSLKIHITLYKNKKYMLLSKKCGSFLKKTNHTSHPNTIESLPQLYLFWFFIFIF